MLVQIAGNAVCAQHLNSHCTPSHKSSWTFSTAKFFPCCRPLGEPSTHCLERQLTSHSLNSLTIIHKLHTCIYTLYDFKYTRNIILGNLQLKCQQYSYLTAPPLYCITYRLALQGVCMYIACVSWHTTIAGSRQCRMSIHENCTSTCIAETNR